MHHRGKIPRPTVKRLSLYLRELEGRAASNQSTIDSRQLGQTLGLTDAQVRKDLAYFGQFGHPGIGYKVPELIAGLRRILGTDRSWSAVVIGAGNIGRAVVHYGRLERKGFRIVAVFDNDPEVIGTNVAGHVVRPTGELAEVVRGDGVQIGVVAVPAEVAQDVATDLVGTGVSGILNFAPRRLDVGDRVAIVSVDLTLSLEQLAFKMALGMPGSVDDGPDPAPLDAGGEQRA